MNNIEWLSNSLSLKKQSLELGTGRTDIDWTDKCGVFQKLGSEHLKSLAQILAWGDIMDTTRYFNQLVSTLAGNMVNKCIERKLQPRECAHDLVGLATLMARMVVTFHTNPILQKVYPTIFGRLYFAGIKMNEDTYRKTWREFQIDMEDSLYNWAAMIDHIVGEYRENLSEKAGS